MSNKYKTILLGAGTGLIWAGAGVAFFIGYEDPAAERTFEALVGVGAALLVICYLRKRATVPIPIEIAYKLGFQHGRNTRGVEGPPEEK